MGKKSCFSCSHLERAYYFEADTVLYSCSNMTPQVAWRKTSQYSDIKEDIGADCRGWNDRLGKTVNHRGCETCRFYIPSALPSAGWCATSWEVAPSWQTERRCVVPRAVRECVPWEPKEEQIDELYDTGQAGELAIFGNV